MSVPSYHFLDTSRRGPAGLIPSIFLGVFVALHGLISILVLNPAALAPISDEGEYLTLAKALATTGEYRLISLPGEPWHTKYPILYPGLLSMVWSAIPDFPKNILYFRSLSLMCGLGFLLFLKALLPRILNEADEKRSVLVIVLCSTNPALIASSTAIMAEAVYLFFASLALVCLIELDRKPNIKLLLASAVCLALAFYARIVGISLIIAATSYFGLKRKWRDTAKLLVATLLLIGPWFYWCSLHNESVRFPEYVFNTSNYALDLKQFVEVQGVRFVLKDLLYIILGIPKLLVYPYQTNLRLITFLSASVGLFALVLLLMGFCRSCYRGNANRLVHCYVATYLFILIVWPYPAGERFLLPLLPFLYAFVLAELSNIDRLIKAGTARLAGTWKSNVLAAVPFGVLMIGFSSLGYHTLRFAVLKTQELRSFDDRNEELQETFQWIKQETLPSDFLMANLNAVYYLHTGRKTAPMSFEANRELDDPSFDPAIIRKHGIKYLVISELDFSVFTPDIVQKMSKELRRVISCSEEFQFERAFKSKHGKYEIYLIRDEVPHVSE